MRQRSQQLQCITIYFYGKTKQQKINAKSLFIFLQKHDDVYVDFLAIHAVINMSKKFKNLK